MTAASTPSLDRRLVISSIGAALAAPMLARRALASSGTVRVYTWAGYLTPEMLAAFERETGIRAIFTPFATNDELFNQLRASNGRGFDIVWPTVDRVPNFVEFNLIQPLDDTRIKWDRIVPSAVKGSRDIGAVVDGKLYQVPLGWGTEAVAFDRSQVEPSWPTASYGDIWAPEMRSKATVRGHSALVGLGLWMESEGKLPAPMRDAFINEERMIPIYDAILVEALARRRNIVQFWNNQNEAQGAFRLNGAAIGQTWDSTGAALAAEGLPIGFIAPREGALAWMQGACIPAQAENIDQAYEFINWMVTPQAGAMFTNVSSVNSTGIGAAELTNDDARAFFQAAYPENALDQIWWWPIQETWFVNRRNEYQDRFMAAR